ncbi:MAG TPA: 2'-5' RNA ligase family protein [Caulobacteraceae bacterium]|jgi:2'-5' RNA ligase
MPVHLTRRDPGLQRLILLFQPSEAERRITRLVGDMLRDLDGIAAPVRTRLLHATVAVLLDIDMLSDAVIERYKAIGDYVAKRRFEQFDLRFNRASRREAGHQPLVLTSADGRRTFRAMQQAIVDAMGLLRLPPLPHGLSNPHTTLLYGEGKIDRPITPVPWRLKELRLVHSHVGLSRHDVLETWTLPPALDLFSGLDWTP